MSNVENPLMAPLRALFRRPGPALSEYQLIDLLKSRGLVEPDYSQDPLNLFRVHFCVFNALYRLRAELWPRGLALDISPLAIACRVLSAGEKEHGLRVSDGDALGRYYLDWSHYQAATGESVAELLADFWRRLGGAPDPVARERALAELELRDPVSDGEIKQRYRRLAMRHHPDRGGDAQRLQELNAAVAVLLG